MKLMTTDEMIKSVPIRWKLQYLKLDGWYDKDKKIVYEKLSTMKNPRKEDIDSVIGNSSWTELWCDECGESSSMDHIHFKKEGTICVRCIDEASKLINKHKSKG